MQLVVNVRFVTVVDIASSTKRNVHHWSVANKRRQDLIQCHPAKEETCSTYSGGLDNVTNKSIKDVL